MKNPDENLVHKDINTGSPAGQQLHLLLQMSPGPGWHRGYPRFARSLTIAWTKCPHQAKHLDKLSKVAYSGKSLDAVTDSGVHT